MRVREDWSADRLVLLAVVLMILLGWEIAARRGWISALFFPAPSTILLSVASLLRSGRLLDDFAATLFRVVLGTIIGCVPAALLGLLIGWSARLRRLFDPVIAALHPVPKIAILPLLMVIFGIGEASRTAAIAFSAFFPMLISVSAGVRQISGSFFEVVESYGGHSRQVLRHVVLPGSLPMLITGLRLSLNVALLLTIAVEFVAAKSGLGALIWLSWETFRTERLYAGLLVISLFGIGMNALLQLSARRLIPWQKDRPA